MESLANQISEIMQDYETKLLRFIVDFNSNLQNPPDVNNNAIFGNATERRKKI